MTIASVAKKFVAILLLSCTAWISHAAIVASAATGTSFASSATVTTFSLNRPSSVNVGDLLFVQITVSANVSASVSGGGWTLLDDDLNNSVRQMIFYRVATAGDTAGGATSWTISSAALVVASMTGYRSDLGGRTVVLGTSTSTTGNSNTMTAPAITATAPGRLVRFYGHNSTSVLTSATLTTHVSARANTLVTLLTGSRTIASSGATTTDVVTASSARFVIHSVLLTESTLSKPTTCYTDNFSSTTTFGQNWVTTTVGTNAFTPSIVGGRLRLTDATGYEATGATLQRLFPTSNLVYVEFNHYAYNGSGADGIAVTLSDSTITPQPGGFGGSLGYAPRDGTINGFAGGWMGIALDEYGNYSNPTEGRNGGPGARVDAVAIRGSGSGQTGYPYVAGTATLSPGIDNSGSTSAAPGYRYRIVIDAAATGQTYVTVDRDTTGAGTSYANLIPTFNIESSASQAAIPANLMLTLTGSSGGSTNIHEIGNLSVCATTINSTNQVDHFEFTYPVQALTCDAPPTVTIRACADAACSTLMSVPVALTMSSSASASFVGGNTVTFTGSTTMQLRQTTAGNATFSVASSSPGAKPFSTNKCIAGSVTTSSNTCTLPFVDTGLLFDVPNTPANKPTGSVRLRAVRTDNSTNACTSLIPAGSTRNIDFWFNYTSPAASSVTPARVVEVRSVNPSGIFQGRGTSAGSSPGLVPLLFQTDSLGDVSANFEVHYNDAGQMQLFARYTDTSGTGVVLNGSDSFVSYPVGFCVRAATVGTPTTYLTCPAGDVNCPIFATAGNPFVLNIAAVAWQSDTDTDLCTGNGDTPNYVQSSLALTSQVIAPIATPQPINGVVSPTTTSITANSSVTIANATESEVGTFTFTVTPPTYFGVTIPPGVSATVGRFIPHHFSLASGSSLVNRATSCAVAPAFSYIGETLNLKYQLNALNANSVLTQNYQGAFARLSTFAQMNTAAIATSPRTAFTVASTPTAITNPFNVTWTNGQGSVISPVSAIKTATAGGPYLSTAFGIAPVDGDSVAGSGFDLDTDAPAAGGNDHLQTGPVTELRYGRLRLDSVSGPANMSLAIPITAEYWNGAGFVVNSADNNCTTVNSSSAAFGTYRGNLSTGETTKSGSGAIINGQTLSALQLSAPGTGNEGSVDLFLDTSAWPWLQFDWNGDGTLDTNATATASFGTYRGSDRVIYWQETQ